MRQSGTSLPPSGRSARSPVFYGWIVLGVATLAFLLSGPGQTYGVSAFIDPLMADQGWSRSLVSGMYSAGTLTAGLTMALIGRLVDVRGYRRMLTILSLCFAGALFFMSTVKTPAMLFIGFVLIRMFGQGSMTLVPSSLVPQWFVAKRGRALTVLAFGGALSSAILPAANIALIGAWGWRTMWVFWGTILAVVMAPLAWRFTRDRPEDMGLRPDGAASSESAAHDAEQQANQLQREAEWTAGEAMRTTAFWVILIATSIPSMVGTGAQFHHMSIMSSRGVGLAVAAAVFSVSAGVRVAALPVIGWLSDRVDAKYLLSAGLVLQAATVLALLAVNSTASALAVGVLQGLKLGVLAIIGGIVWPHYFGRRNLASIRGVATAGMVISSALGPLPFGLGYDIFGGYTQIILLMAGITLVGAVAVLRLRKPKHPEHVAAAGMSAAGGGI